MQGRVEAPLWRPDSERKSIMSNKPTHTAYVVVDPKEGSEKKAPVDRDRRALVAQRR